MYSTRSTIVSLAISTVVFVFVCILPAPALGVISFTDGAWPTTFDGPAWEQEDSLSCNGIGMYGGWKADGQTDQIVSAANSIGGDGGGSLPTDTAIPIDVLFGDPIEDGDFTSRGWYDGETAVLSSDQCIPDSANCIEYRFTQGSTSPFNTSTLRHLFDETESVYLSYYVKYSSNWVGSQRNYHPHEFYILTNKDDAWSGLAYTNLTAYVEQNGLYPRMVIQDGRNTDNDRIGENLVDQTEDRSVAGCNGDSDGHGDGICYPVGDGEYWNGKQWAADATTITTGQWHKVEAFFKLNSVIDGKGVADGVVQYWLDGERLMNHHDVMFRTARHADMKFNQLVIAPWIGDGSPVDQTFWVDHIVVGKASTSTSPTCTDGVQNGNETDVDCGGVCADCGDATNPHAAFSSDPYPATGTAPFTVNFSDNSTGAPTSWKWDFDSDGNVDSTEQHPQYTYTIEGEFTASLVVTNGEWDDTATMVVRIMSDDIDGDSTDGENSSGGSSGGGCLINTLISQ